MVGLVLVKSLYAIPTWTRTVALVKDHAGLRDVGAAPSADACYRFTVKLRTHGDMLAACITKVLAGLHEAHPEMGTPSQLTVPTFPPMRTGGGT